MHFICPVSVNLAGQRLGARLWAKSVSIRAKSGVRLYSAIEISSRADGGRPGHFTLEMLDTVKQQTPSVIGLLFVQASVMEEIRSSMPAPCAKLFWL